MKEKLINFLYKYFFDDTELLLDIIDRNNISLLLAKYVKEIDKEIYKKIRANRAVQKLFYDKVLDEIKILISEFDKANIKLVFMKGVFLAKDLYEDISERSSKDIDVSIDREDFFKSHLMLRKLGYECADFTDEEIEANDYLDYWREQHICYEKMNKSIKIYLEIHGNILNAGEAFDVSTKEFLDNSRRVNVMGLNPYLLTPEYNLIYLILHFIKHIPLSYTHYSIMGMKPEVNLGALTDIALYIKKYEYVIDWHKFLKLCEKMRIVRYAFVTIKLMNDIYADAFNEKLMQLLQEKVQYTHINKIEYERCGWGKFIWLFEKTLDVMEHNHLSKILTGNFLDYISMVDMAKKESKHLVNVGDKYVFEQTFSVDLNIESGISKSILKVCVDRKSVDITYSIKNKKLICYTREKKAYHSDGIDILVVTPRKIIHKLFSVAREADEYYLVESSQDYFCENVERIIENAYKAKLKVAEESCYISVNIPWEVFGVNPLLDKAVPFNVAGLMTSPITLEYTGNYQLYDNMNDLFDFRFIPVLLFDYCNKR